MSDKKKDKRTVVDHIFHAESVSRDTQGHFERWILREQESAWTDEILKELWDSEPVEVAPAKDRVGFVRLKQTIHARRISRIRRNVVRHAVAAVVAVALFAGGYFAATLMEPAVSTVTLVSAKGHVGEFTLPDGSRVWLNSESSLSYRKGFAGATRDVTLSGEAYFEVERDTMRAFRVQMNSLTVEVLGTSFDAKSYSGSAHSEVVLKSGSVKVSGANLRSALRLVPGERLSHNRLSDEVRVESVDAEMYCQWFAPRIIFDNTPLRSVIAGLERRYNIEIGLSSRIEAERKLSMVVTNESLDEIMEVLASLLSARYTVEEGRAFILQ